MQARAVPKGKRKGSATPTEMKVHVDALRFTVKTWARRKTNRSVVGQCWWLAAGVWQLAVGSWWRLAVDGWWRLAVGGWRLVVLGDYP